MDAAQSEGHPLWREFLGAVDQFSMGHFALPTHVLFSELGLNPTLGVMKCKVSPDSPLLHLSPGYVTFLSARTRLPGQGLHPGLPEFPQSSDALPHPAEAPGVAIAV